MKTSKEKLDEALGISCGKSFDEMLEDLNIDSDEQTKRLDEVGDEIRNAFDGINQKALEIQKGDSNGVLAIADMNDSLRQIEGLIGEARDIFAHVKDNILGSDLIDSELVESGAKLLESIHCNISEFISVYKQKLKFVEKIKLMIFQQQQKIELMNLKHRQNLELLAAKDKGQAETGAIDADGGVMDFDTDSVIKSLAKAGKFQDISFENEITPENDDRIDRELDGDSDEDEENVRRLRNKNRAESE